MLSTSLSRISPSVLRVAALLVTIAQAAFGQGVDEIYIREFRVQGASSLPAVNVENAVYPWLGPGRSSADVEQARAALEEAYRAQGYQAVSVAVPQQQIRRGVVVLQVQPGSVARLRVKGSRYYDLDAIRRRAQSVAEGQVVNFNRITDDLIALNQLPDRKISPSMVAGEVPGTVDIDLLVEDTLPLHGSLELNNRQSADTSPLRLNASINYHNLWQLGHTIGLGYQTAPESIEESEVWSAFYIARFPDVPKFSILLQGTKQDSNVSTLGGAAVAGRGEILGMRFIFTLEPRKGFYHSVNFGFDYKSFDQEITFGGESSTVPISYYPISLAYTATWVSEKYVSELNAGFTFHLRGVGSDPAEFDDNRFRADGSFLYFRGDASHTHKLPFDSALYARIYGQATGYPLLNSEQYGGGGQDTVRGYLEAEALGDNAIGGTLELRSPSLISRFALDETEWRLHAFVDAAYLTLNDPLPEQTHRFELASIGVGSTLKLFKYLNGSVDIATPLIALANTREGDTRVLFRLWGEF